MNGLKFGLKFVAGVALGVLYGKLIREADRWSYDRGVEEGIELARAEAEIIRQREAHDRAVEKEKVEKAEQAEKEGQAGDGDIPY